MNSSKDIENKQENTTEISNILGEDIENNKPEQIIKMPQKRNYRMRAHINPLNVLKTAFPKTPDFVNWKLHFPIHYGGNLEQNIQIHDNSKQTIYIYIYIAYKFPIEYNSAADNEVNGNKGKSVEIVDIGCGYGGLMIKIAEFNSSQLVLGMEIRGKLVNFVSQRICAFRNKYQHEQKVYSFIYIYI